MQPIHFRSILSVSLVCVCSWTFLCAGPAFAQPNEAEPSTWGAVEKAAYVFMEEEKFDEALALVEQAAPDVQDHDFEVSDLVMTILFAAGRPDEAMNAWEKGLQKGYFYFVIPRSASFDGLRGQDRFKQLLAHNNRLREKANLGSKPEYHVITPAAYSSENSYPMLIIIHGGNQSIVKAMETWDPEVIGDDLIIAYVQSSMQAATGSFRWDLGGVDIYSAPTAQDEVLGLYETIISEYAVDTDRVALAGFSQGGNLALFMASEGTIPAKGFIAGCPATRTPVSAQAAQAAAARGVRGTIFVGAEDWTAQAVEDTVANFKTVDLAVNLIVMEGKGHEYPENFDEVLRQALDHLFQ